MVIVFILCKNGVRVLGRKSGFFVFVEQKNKEKGSKVFHVIP